MEPHFKYSDLDTLGHCWVHYDGNFINNTKDGFGKLYLKDGSWFEGHF